MKSKRGWRTTEKDTSAPNLGPKMGGARESEAKNEWVYVYWLDVTEI